ncbi:MAG TPA: hypothetical protein VIM73_02785 [Polyangiaceae bacterium]
MMRALRYLGFVCLACGGSGAPAESAAGVEEVPEASSEPADSTPMPASEEPPSPASDAATPASETGAPASKEDVQAILQLVLDDEELTPFLRLERPDRFPLRIAGDLPPGLELTKATKPVEIVDASEGKKKPVVVFTELSIGPQQANVRYRYDVEGVRGSCTLDKREGRWVLARSRITSR